MNRGTWRRFGAFVAGMPRTSHRPAMPRNRTLPGLPSKEQVIEFIQSSETPAGKREIAKAFGLKGDEKIALKRLLPELAQDPECVDLFTGEADLSRLLKHPNIVEIYDLDP